MDLERYWVLLAGWFCVLCRLTGIFVLAPIFASRAIPTAVKVFAALTLSVCVSAMLVSAGKIAPDRMVQLTGSAVGLWSLVPAVGAELLVGLVVGYGAMLPVIGMQLAGRLIAQQMGLGLAELFSLSEEADGTTSQIFYLLTLSLFLILGGHRVLLMVLVRSFDRIEMGSMLAGAEVLALIVGLVTISFELAVHAAAPLLCLLFCQTLAMGFLARTVPQLHILSIGFPLRILVGALVLAGSLGAVAGLFVEAMQRTLGDLELFFGLG